MKVAIDGHMVGGRETGNETYVKGLVGGLATRSDVDVTAYYSGRPWAPELPHLHFQRLLTPNPFVRLGLELPLRSMGRLDVLHMSYSAPLWSAAPVVLTVHDICYATNPEWFSERDLRVLRANIPRSIRRSAHVITDSENARGQIMAVYRVPESRITAIPIGPGAGAEPIDADEARTELTGIGLDPSRPYLLAVGNLQPRKNLVRMVEAYQSVIEKHDVDLVVVGPRHYRADDVVKAASSLAQRVRFTGYITDRQLAACYRCSTAFVFPSLYEGFGLPAIEAMSHGVPMACSNAGALPEVCGDAAVLFDPTSVEAMAEAINAVLDDSSLRARLSAAGLARAKTFSWARTAELTLDVYRRAVA